MYCYIVLWLLAMNTPFILGNQFDELRRLFQSQQETTQKFGEFLCSLEGQKSANSSCLSLQSGDISKDVSAMSAEVSNAVSNAEVSQVSAAESEQNLTKESEITMAEEQEEPEPEESLNPTLEESQVVESEESESDEDFDVANFKLRKSIAHGRQSIAPEQKAKRKTQRMTKIGPGRKRSSIMNQNEEDEKVMDQPASKRKSSRKTFDRRTVNFNFG